MSSRAEEIDHTIRLAGYVLVAAGALVLLFWLGKHVADELRLLEQWIQSLGVWGPVVFVVAVVILTSFFVPDSIPAIAAGVLFGLWWGTVLTFVAAILTAIVNYSVARVLLRSPIESIIAEYPRFAAIQSAVNREGLRLLLLLRLSPINPVSISYVLGAGGARFGPFVVALIGLLPALFVEVYLGHMALHLTDVSSNPAKHSPLETAVTVAGLVISALLIVYVGRVAKKALAEAETAATAT